MGVPSGDSVRFQFRNTGFLRAIGGGSNPAGTFQDAAEGTHRRHPLRRLARGRCSREVA